MTPKNLQKVYQVFEKNYKPIPLEVFGKKPYQTLISTLMSARTNDDTTLKAANRLFTKADNIKKLNNLDIKKIEELIYPVGFYKTKAKHIKLLTQKVISEFSGRIPQTRVELMTLPGVGRKTANLVLNRAFGKPAIAVDTHVHRITNLLGWVRTKNPEETERELVKIIPKKYWSETNRLFVGIGRQFKGVHLIKFLKKNKLISKP